ncbi:UNVERIFIED_CONTAM: hypothetical protein FKN15_048232 [Acipenser sinensis]
MIRNSAMFQTAGCLRYAQTVEDRKTIVRDYLRWYIIFRNHFQIQRFKDGLATLNLLNALQQHTSVLADYMCYSGKKMTAADIENLFGVEFSLAGSNRRSDETRIMGYWADYLMD